jgi:LL-diaminopimelate aminotransferase
MRANGVDVIRLDMGSPDLPPAPHIIKALTDAARREDTHGYTLGSGTHQFREAVANHYSRRFGVELDPKTDVIDLIGSKEGLFIISQVLLNPGDVTLVPDPAYGVYSSGARVAGGEVHFMPLLAENKFLPDLNAIPEDKLAKAKILWLNYPNNPTGAIADLDYFQRVVDFGRKHHIIIAHDAPYVDVAFNGYRAPSLLEIPGASEVSVEFNSLSKAYNMAGWRVGMVSGKPEVLKHIEIYKSQQDSAHFAPVLAAGVAALSGDQSWIEDRNAVYQERRDLVIDALRTAGIHADIPRAAFYIWAELPKGFKSMDFCEQMLDEIGVSTTPGKVFGQFGEGFLRISLITPIARMREGLDRIVDWLAVKV